MKSASVTEIKQRGDTTLYGVIESGSRVVGTGNQAVVYYTEYFPQKVFFDYWALSKRLLWEEGFENNMVLGNRASETPAFGLLYDIVDDTYVYNFLEDNPELKNLLVDIYQKLEAYFGPGSLFSIEWEEGVGNEFPECLVVGIVAFGDLESLLDKYENFCDSWWYTESARINGKIIINLRT